MTHCPYCGSGEIAPAPNMRGGQDASGALAYYRCECKAIFSRLTVPMGGVVSPRSAIGKPAHPSPGAER